MPQLTKCKACDAVVSEKAVACPQCGNPIKKQRTQIGCGGTIGVIFLFLVAYFIYTGSSTPSAPKTPPTPAELRTQKIEKQFSAWDGAHIKLERSVEASLKDPDSYEHIESRYADKGDFISVVLKYRAKNSFGGYVVNSVIASYDLQGNLIEGPISVSE